jgi:hypothetical protein
MSVWLFFLSFRHPDDIVAGWTLHARELSHIVEVFACYRNGDLIIGIIPSRPVVGQKV